MAVNLFGVEHLDADFLPVIARQFVEEAGAFARVASRAPDLFYFYQNDVLVAIRIKRLHFLHIPGFFALFPELLAAAAPIGHVAAFDRVLQGFAVGEGEHEDLACFFVLRDDGDEPVLLEFQRVDPAHGYPQK